MTSCFCLKVYYHGTCAVHCGVVASYYCAVLLLHAAVSCLLCEATVSIVQSHVTLFAIDSCCSIIYLVISLFLGFKSTGPRQHRVTSYTMLHSYSCRADAPWSLPSACLCLSVCLPVCLSVCLSIVHSSIHSIKHSTNQAGNQSMRHLQAIWCFMGRGRRWFHSLRACTSTCLSARQCLTSCKRSRQ